MLEDDEHMCSEVKSLLRLQITKSNVAKRKLFMFKLDYFFSFKLR